MRIEHFEKSIKDIDELERYMFDNSWVTICDKGDFYKYNFQTKEKKPL